MEYLPLKQDGYKVYAGFWQRFGAGIIDAVLLVPLGYLFYSLQSLSIAIAMIVMVFYSILYAVYAIYFHYKFGATLGKMVTKIKVTNRDGSPIDLEQAVLRSSVDIGFAIIAAAAQIIAISNADPQQYLAAGWIERSEYIIPLLPVWHDLVVMCSTLWVYSEFFVMLLNKRKRAIHDFLADTIVINRKYASQESRSEQAGPNVLNI